MPYDIEELKALRDQEKIFIIKELFLSLSETSEEERAFVEKCLNSSLQSTIDVKSVQKVIDYFNKKYYSQ